MTVTDASGVTDSYSGDPASNSLPSVAQDDGKHGGNIGINLNSRPSDIGSSIVISTNDSKVEYGPSSVTSATTSGNLEMKGLKQILNSCLFKICCLKFIVFV